jgi:16S rRNA (cytosine1402-N4)-methyltransferase
MGNHYPVMLDEAISMLDVKEDGIYVDCTLGRAGHSGAILSRCKKGHLYCFDLDETALSESKSKLEAAGNNFTLIHSSFACLKEKLSEMGVSKVDGVLADLGVSSPQFDDSSRGFSYKEEARLDMRMDKSQALSAYEVVNDYDLSSLTRLLYEYGEERDARAIASNIVKARQNKKIVSTLDLVDIVKKSKSAKELAKKGHPAKQTFQAIRMEVNGEEDALKALLAEAPLLLNKGGRLAIITFMSIDDRLVKRRFHELSFIEADRHAPLDGPNEEPDYRLLTKKPIVPSEKELAENRRSASAKLRAIERI